MDEMNRNVIEEIAPDTEAMDLAWMASFWEVFTECVIETDAQYIVKNIRRKADSNMAIAVVGQSFLDVVAERDRTLAEEELGRLKASLVSHVRFQVMSSRGRYYRWTLVANIDNGEFAGCRGVAVDVTEQTLKDITLNWQRAVIEGGSDFVSIADREGHVLYANSGAYKMTGYAPGSTELAHKLLFPPELLSELRGDGLKVIFSGGSWSGLGELICADGTLLPIAYNMFSVGSEQEETLLVATVFRDITVFLEHERTLQEARLAAEAANVAKSEFLSRMSHEIRTPMNAVVGMINIGLSSDDVNRKNYCFTRADRASKHLLGVINDILDMSKIEAEKFELSYSEFGFEDMLKNITNMANIRAEEKAQEFIVRLANDIPTAILGDELRLSQVITNLLSNAMKFTPQNGMVMLSVKKLGETNNRVVLKFEVADSGIGISAQQQEKLFTSFNQADSSISQNFGGTGLGLAISKRIVELMGGNIWIESELGHGAKFIFTLETEKGEEKPRVQLYDKIDTKKLRILAIDDSKETRDYFTYFMRSLKIPCDVASDGAEALRMIKNSDAPYDIFFVDWQMPDANGIELAGKIKECCDTGSIIIMIPETEWNNVERDALAAGARHSVPKPLFPSTLVNAINICMGAGIYKSSGLDRNTATERSYDFSGHTVLVVEDVEINREIMSAVLEETGAAIDFAENGEIAVFMFEASPWKYDLILMDVNMPVMDGFEATRCIRALNVAEAKSVPIVAMTANVFKEDVRKCLEAGMNDHTGKPIDSAQLFKQIHKHLTLKRGF